MSLGRRLISTGGVAACTTDSADVFGDGNGVALYNLDYDASDASGNYDGTPTDVTFGVGGKTNYGARFNGSSSKIVTTLNANGFSQIAISCWIKTDLSSGAGSGHIVSANDGTNWCFLSIAKSTGIVTFSASNGGSNIFSATHTGAINDGNWHHVVGNYNGTNATLYIDSTGHTPVSATASLSVNTAFGIGYRNTASPSGTYYDGDIDQVRIFNRALTSGEVDTLYNNGNGETACVYTATTTDNYYPVANTMYHKLDNSVDDEVGTATSTELNMQYRFGRFGQAGLFNGTVASGGSQINTNYNTEDTALTHSIWINQSGLGSSGFNVVLGRYYDGTTPLHLGYYMWTNATTINWRVFYGGSGGTTSQYVEASGTISQNQWHHIVATWTDGTGAKLYIDGDLAQSTSSTQTRNKNGIPLTLGTFDSRTNNAKFLGLLDTHRYFNSELSESQVTELYNEKPETDTSNFKTVLYEGTGATQYISNVGFQPDLVWIKNREQPDSHQLFDSVRDAGFDLHSDTTAAQPSSADTTSLTSFDSNGFSISTNAALNTNTEDYVSWCWKGSNADPVTNDLGDIDSQVSANDKGFSIVKHANSGSTSDTVGHGLTVNGVATTPELYITKKYDTTTNWNIYTTVIDGSMDRLLFTNAAKSDVSLNAPTSTVFYNQSGTSDSKNYISYCFASVSGVSKIGSYEGNAGTQTIYTTDDGTSSGSGGFEPSFVMMKNVEDTTNSHWLILDSARSTTNPREDEIYANLNLAEQDLNRSVNFVSNGFELTSSTYTNRSGIDYIFMAFK